MLETNMEVMGYKILSQIKKNDDTEYFLSEELSEQNPKKAMIIHSFLPTKKQYDEILALYNNDIEKVDEFILTNIEILKQKLSNLKLYNQNDDTISSPILNFEVKKRENFFGYDVYIATKQLIDLAIFTKANAMDKDTIYNYSSELLLGLKHLKQMGIDASYVEIDDIYVDSFGKIKIPNLILKDALNASKFNLTQDESPRKTIVSSAMCIYALYNNLEFNAPFTNDKDSLYSYLLSGAMKDSLKIPAQMDTNVFECIKKAFDIPFNSYQSVIEFSNEYDDIKNKPFIMVNEEKPIVEEKTDVYKEVSNPTKEIAENKTEINEVKPPVVINPPVVNMVTPAIDNKKSKKKAILIASLSALFVIIVGIILYFVFFNAPKDDTIKIQNPISVVCKNDEIEISGNDTYELELDIENGYLEDLVFEVEDEDVVIMEDYKILPVGLGETLINIYDKNGNLLEDVNIKVIKKEYLDKDYITNEILSKDIYEDAKFGLYVYDIMDETEYIFDSSDDVLGSSALVTLPIVYTYYKELYNGNITEDTLVTFEHTYKNGARKYYEEEDDARRIPISELVKNMLLYSDNNCINTLMNYFTLDTIAECMEENGFDSTKVLRNLVTQVTDNVENKISAQDAGRMLKELLENSLSRDFLEEYFMIKDQWADIGMTTEVDSSDLICNHNALTSTKYNEIMYVLDDDNNYGYIVVFISNDIDSDKRYQASKDVSAYIYGELSQNRIRR